MNKNLRIYGALVLGLAVFFAAKNSPAWAGASTNAEDVDAEVVAFAPDLKPRADEPTAITITESGNYSLAGICTIEIAYKAAGVQNDVDAEVPIDFSKQVPFGYEGDIYLPGCHMVHYKDGQVVKQASENDGFWEVCFAERPDIQLTIYHYFDDIASETEVWIELPTTHKDGLACALAPYTGEYAPGSADKPAGDTDLASQNFAPPANAGTVLPPPASNLITASGTYSGGGVCQLEVLYKAPELSDDLHVADVLKQDHDDVDGYDRDGFASFPDNEGLLYYPGCHVLHFEKNEIYKWQMGDEKGAWKICFAARPDKENTIYIYLGDYTDQASEWKALPTTMEDGLACAPAQETGVYVPTGK